MHFLLYLIPIVVIVVVTYVRKSLYPYGSIRALVFAWLGAILSSTLFLRLKWISNALAGSVNIDKRKIVVFISIDDPQSFVLLQCMKVLMGLYRNIDIEICVLPPHLKTWSSNEIDQSKWISMNAQQFSELYNLVSPECLNIDKSVGLEDNLTYHLCHSIKKTKFSQSEYLDFALDVLHKYWTNDFETLNRVIDDLLSENLNFTALNKELSQNTLYLNKLGYYGPGVVSVEGEIYQPNRLHYLERRMLEYQLVFNKLKNVKFNIMKRMLFALNIFTNGLNEAIFNNSVVSYFDERIHFKKHIDIVKNVLTSNIRNVVPKSNTEFKVIYIELFYSFRSPYSQLALLRLMDICSSYNKHFRDHEYQYELKIRVRVMIPMVLRGLAISFAKLLFIVQDCGREAKLWNVKFGRMCDPIYPDGKPVQRALDVYTLCVKENKEIEYIQAFATNVWAEGVNIGSDSGLKAITDSIEISWDKVAKVIGNKAVEEEWRGITTSNREYLRDKNLWGVPCIQVENEIVWGQDQLHRIIEKINKILENDS